MRTVLLLAVALAATPVVAWQDAEASKQKIKGLKEYGKQGSSAIAKISPYLQDGDPAVRREAVKSLIAAGGPQSLDPLTQACKDNDSEVQIRATDGLVNFYVSGYVDESLTASLKRVGNSVTGKLNDAPDVAVDRDTPVRQPVVECMIHLVSGGASLEVRANAARALGVLRAKDGAPVLIESLRSKDSTLMYESLISLQKIGDRANGPRAAFLVRDPDPRVQIAAMETAGVLVTRDAVPDLKRAIETTTDRKVRRAAQTALGQIADPGSAALYRSWLADKEDEARGAGAEGLGRLDSKADLTAVKHAFDEERKMSPHLAQAFALSLLGSVGTAPTEPLGYLINTLNVKSYRNVALAYLIELARRKPSRDAMIQILSGAPTRDEKTGLSQALASCGSKDAIPALERLVKDEDPAIGREAIRALRILRATAN